ncbi:TPA: GNAT family N-acetyltransferase [bacterium]|nr:GNAT family N-acetyltransferase [bacterium]
MPRQLKMLYPTKQHPPTVALSDGYSVRTFRKGDEEKYAELLNNKNLGDWTVERLSSILDDPLSPDGVFFVTYGDDLVAVACAQDRGLNSNQEKVGEIGWVAGDPAHKGKNIGLAVCASAVNYLLDLGYKEIYLLTDHFRYPALKTYIKLGFEPRLDGADDRYLWKNIYEKLGFDFPENTKKAKYIKHPNGEEIAWRTLNKEKVNEPCILSAWCMKRSFFQSLTYRDDIYTEDAPDIVIEAFIRAGANLCPQFIMPSPITEHMAYDPFYVSAQAKSKSQPQNTSSPKPKAPTSPEDVRDIVNALPDPYKLEKDYNIEAVAENYARYIMNMNERAKHEILFISGFGMPSFMGGYGWGYVNYLSALKLYPDIMEKYFAYGGENGRLYNMAVAHAVKKYGLAPYVYTGDDICFNDGPLCSIDMLDKLYFPHLAHAVQPLHDAGIGIVWHSDGNILPIMDQLINVVGVSGFQGFQEETGCTLEKIASYRTRNNEKLILWGSISVTTTLPFGTVDDVKRDVERCFKVASPGGGFGLASTSSILPETPLENIITMFQHGQNFGREFLGSL